MSRFYAEIQGNRGPASRMGTPQSGMWAHVRGWDIGVKVVCGVDSETGKDIITVFRTGGSNDCSLGDLVATITE